MIEEEKVEDEGCQKLNELMQNPAFANAINSNQYDASHSNYETGFSIVRNDQAVNINAIPLNNTSYCNTLDFTPGPNWIGVMHCHPAGCDGVINMFSGQDIFKFFQMIYNFGSMSERIAASRDFFFTMATTSGTYAIKINNFNSFWTASLGMFAIGKEREAEKFYRRFEKQYEASSSLFNSVNLNYDPQLLAKKFLGIINQYNLGLSLYKLDAQDLEWNEIRIVNNNAATLPCN